MSFSDSAMKFTAAVLRFSTSQWDKTLKNAERRAKNGEIKLNMDKYNALKEKNERLKAAIPKNKDHDRW